MKVAVAKFVLLSCSLAMIGVTQAAAQEEKAPNVAPVVALDECDPTTFNAALGPDFCKNVALAALGDSLISPALSRTRACSVSAAASISPAHWCP